jgi:hypothetical protein
MAAAAALREPAQSLASYGDVSVRPSSSFKPPRDFLAPLSAVRPFAPGAAV